MSAPAFEPELRTYTAEELEKVAGRPGVAVYRVTGKRQMERLRKWRRSVSYEEARLRISISKMGAETTLGEFLDDDV